MHDVLLIAFNIGLGAVLGVAGGLLGIGGGLIAIPILGFLYGMDQHMAQGTALVMIVPKTAMPTVEPTLRKNCTVAVATPRSRRGSSAGARQWPLLSRLMPSSENRRA